VHKAGIGTEEVRQGPQGGHLRERQGREDRSLAFDLPEVSPVHSTDEVAEGNEVMEGRRRLRGTTPGAVKGQTQRWQPLEPNLQRVNMAARKSGQTRFTALLHHVNAAALERAYRRQRRKASPGVDGVTVEQYGRDLQENLQNLHERIHSGQYWPKPVRRTYIPKADGGRRGLGVPALEDKIVQGAVAEVLSAIYEADFYGFSYGFRPGRSPHRALKALNRGLMTQQVNWVLDVDIQSFFDSIDHEWILRMVAHRVADPRALRLIRRWLEAGVLEGGEWKAVETGTPQGAGISPLLANVVLHYVFDMWVHEWRRKRAKGQVIVCRYADDLVIGAQNEEDARRLLEALKERLAQFGLRLNEGKTRVIEFGPRAARRRERAGLSRLGTFNFLGFTHYVGRTRKGMFIVKRKTQANRMVRKLKELRAEIGRRRHVPVAAQYRWLCQVLRGHYQYYGVTFNYRPLNQFFYLVKRAWLQALKRRSRKGRMSWEQFNRLLGVYPLPKPAIIHHIGMEVTG
jgi:RNA-directed DNA polymerase